MTSMLLYAWSIKEKLEAHPLFGGRENLSSLKAEEKEPPFSLTEWFKTEAQIDLVLDILKRLWFPLVNPAKMDFAERCQLFRELESGDEYLVGTDRETAEVQKYEDPDGASSLEEAQEDFYISEEGGTFYGELDESPKNPESLNVKKVDGFRSLFVPDA
jgi:hypothetical protein